ncbi:hypothetical protein IG631_08948 [Alternaria alternata]|nr:hypothetical protein IG631_08948 [Alternaria alternata]
MHHLDPYERPPDGIRNVYKKYQKMKLNDLDLDGDIIDLSSDASASSSGRVRVVREYTAEDLTAIFQAFAGEDGVELQDTDIPRSIPVSRPPHHPLTPTPIRSTHTAIPPSPPRSL